jgi:phosphomannomutase
MALVESFSGIRGIYGTELKEEDVRKYALAYMKFLKKRNPDKNELNVVIGRDTRPSGEEIFNIFIKNLNCEIINLNILPTPIIENAVRAFQADGGIIISGSHNEPGYNGFKLLDKDGAILRPKDIDFVIRNVHESDFGEDENRNNTIINKEQEAMVAYKKLLKEILKTDKINSPKILVDPNGGAGISAKEIFDEFGINAHYVNMKQMEFNRLVEPNRVSLKYLEQEIKKQSCDLAIGFDCDADRVEILLDDGTLVSGNHLLALIVDEIISKSKEKTVVVNDATSYVVKEITEKHGGIFKEVEVGEINVVDEMLNSNSLVSGEGSSGGVIIFPTRCRDGILTTLFLLKIISEKNKSLKQLIQELPEYCYIKEKIKINNDFLKMRDSLKDYYKNKGFRIQETGDETGGLKALKENSWVWFRQSKTEDKILRIIVDSRDNGVAESLLKEAKELVS